MAEARSTTLMAQQAFQSSQPEDGEQKPQTLYRILGVSITATTAEINTAYRRLAKIHHPDKGGDAEQFKKIQHAYSVLSDQAQRKAYDEIRNQPDKEREYYQASYDAFIKLMYTALDASLDALKVQAETEKDRKSCIILSEFPVDTFWGAAKSLVTAKKGSALYTVGKPIRINDKPLSFRDSLPDAELLSAFPIRNTQHRILLFSSEMDALDYARATRIGNFYQDAECFQSPIIEVKLLADVAQDSEVKRLQAFINDRCEGHGYHFGEHNMHYIEMDSTLVEAVTATMKIHTAIGYKAYPPVPFSSLQETESWVSYLSRRLHQ